MNTIQVSIPPSSVAADIDRPLSVPVVIPALADVIQLADALHAAGASWEGTAFGWPADYTPEINEANAIFEEYDENGSAQTIVAPRWSPAIFCIGVNDMWFVSLTWELGAEVDPWLYLEDDYGYQFDDRDQVSLLKAKLKRVT